MHEEGRQDCQVNWIGIVRPVIILLAFSKTGGVDAGWRWERLSSLFYGIILYVRMLNIVRYK